MKISNPKVKNFLIFSQKKPFLIFQETETPEKVPYISENGTFLYLRKWRKTSYISGRNFPSSKNLKKKKKKKKITLKNFLIFREM